MLKARLHHKVSSTTTATKQKQIEANQQRLKCWRRKEPRKERRKEWVGAGGKFSRLALLRNISIIRALLS